jgi:hypothetical protein
MSKIDFSKILIQPEKGKSTCQVFVLDLRVDAEEEANQPANKIFGLIEVEIPPNRRVASFINALIQEIKPDQFIGSGKSPETIFEKLLQKINYKYIELISNKSVFSDEGIIPKINALLVLESNKNIYLAARGRIFPFLIYQAKPQNYKIINIAETASGREARQSNINLFTNIISGKINQGDYILLSTESLLDYFSLEKLCKLISASAPEESSNNLKELLEASANPETPFAALILKSQPKSRPIGAIETAAEKPTPISTPQHSMAGLLKTAAETEKMLTPSLRLNIGAGVSSLADKLKNIFGGKKEVENKNKARLEYYPSTFSPPSSLNKFFKTIYFLLFSIFRALYFVFKKIILLLAGLLKIIFYLVTNKGGRRKTILRETFGAQQKKLRDIKSNFGQLPRISKSLLAFVLIFIILFLGSTVVLYQKYRKGVVLESISQRVEIIHGKKSLAEASLIYNDEEGARKALLEAQDLLAEFSQKSPHEKLTYESLKKEIDLLQEKLRHVINIDQAVSIANFTGQNPNAKVSEFLISKNNLYAFDDDASVVYKLNLETKEIITKNTSGFNLKFGFSQNSASAIFYQPENKFFEFDFLNDVIREKEVILNENETKISDLAIYNQRLYVLGAGDKQIYRHASTLTGFARGTPWLQEELDIENATSIAIDGSIYLTKSNGEIIKLSNGTKDDFTASIDPAISSPAKIWTSPDSKYLYILEPAKKRLVVLDKDGKLKNQYFGEQFNDLKDFTVLEKEKKIYLLNGTQIYGIVADHLQ